MTKKPSLWAFGGLTPLRLGKQVWKQTSEDEVSVRSASLAYYFVLAVFPAMLFLLSLLGFFAGPGTQLRDGLFSTLARLLPGSASDLTTKPFRKSPKPAAQAKRSLGSWVRFGPLPMALRR